MLLVSLILGLKAWSLKSRVVWCSNFLDLGHFLSGFGSGSDQAAQFLSGKTTSGFCQIVEKSIRTVWGFQKISSISIRIRERQIIGRPVIMFSSQNKQLTLIWKSVYKQWPQTLHTDEVGLRLPRCSHSFICNISLHLNHLQHSLLRC